MIRVLVVDDSIVFRSQITASLKDIPGVEVVGSAPNGRIALQKIEQSSVDLITLDMEMPELNGIDTLKELRAKGHKTKVIVFSSQTTRGAEKALEALREGADDVVAKPEGDGLNFESALDAIKESLVPKILQFINKGSDSSKSESRLPSIKSFPNIISETYRADLETFIPNAIVIASSTGGPNALDVIFGKFKGANFRKPIFIVQHMPPVFTEILAKRLAEISGLNVLEAKDGELVSPGHVRICLGDFHMKLIKTDSLIKIHLNKDPQRNSVRPAADFLFESAADIYQKKCLGIVLTGMGEDGAQGAQALRKLGGAVMIQNKESCVVFGMPGAVYAANDYDGIGDLEKISKLILRAAS